MIRVLHSVSNMDRAGIETMLMNYYRHMDREKIQFDFIVNRPKPGDYDDEIRRMGGRIFQSPGLNPLHYPQYLRFVQDIIAQDPTIKIVHAHNEAMGLYALNSAKHAGVKVRIAHAHCTQIIRDYKWPLKMFCKHFLPSAATDLWSCGREAGIYFFGKKNWDTRGVVIHNAIEADSFRFDPSIRAQMRERYGFSDKIVLGHVGRFGIQKNHARLLTIFHAFLKLHPNAVLVLVGEGELKEQICQQAVALGIRDKILFAGLQSDVSRWYQMMDLFLLPSPAEGLPVVGVEAQAAGLGCIFSTGIPDEVLFSGHSIRCSLSDSDSIWAEKIWQVLQQPFDRADGINLIRQAGYDISVEAAKLQEMYLQMSVR